MAEQLNPLAVELNATLSGTVIKDLLSDFGKRFYFPKGIISQSAEAKQHAHRFNATAGMAYRQGKPMYLPSIHRHFEDLEPQDIYAYAPTPGVPELRARWKEQLVEKNPSLKGKSTSLPLVVPGLTAGISILGDLFVDAGTPVVVADMFWGNYRLIMSGRREAPLATFSLFSPSGGLDVDAMEQAVRGSVRENRARLILNFPNNPTGYSPTVDEAHRIRDRLIALADEGIQLLVIHDDAYFGLFYEPDTYPASLFGELADAHPNLLAVKVDGATKEDLTWGFRTGFLTFSAKGITAEQYEALVKKAMGAIRASVSSSSRPAQSLLLRAFDSATYEEEKQSAYNTLKERYLKVKEILAAARLPDGIRSLPFNSGYFMAFELARGGAEKLRKSLLHEKGIGTISIEDRYLRVAFASVDNENLEELYREIIASMSEIY
jgi:aspartate/methionine/tyrosine aminotransferase